MGACEQCVIFTDHLAIALRLRRGRGRRVRAKRAHADICRHNWFCMEGRKVDILAKQTAEPDASCGKDQAIEEASHKVTRALHSIGRRHERIDDWGDMQPRAAEKRPKQAE
ncbi:unnamed protein product, partial [Prorocentrum cordatum]